MFHEMIHNRRKALGTFWEKEYDKLKSTGHDMHILPKMKYTLEMSGPTVAYRYLNTPTLCAINLVRPMKTWGAEKSKQYNGFSFPRPELNRVCLG